MAGLILAVLLLLPSLAWAQSSGTGGPYFRDDCTTIPAHITNKILCWEQGTATLKTWNGSAWTSVSGGGTGNVVASGTLDLNFFALGAGATTVKAVSLTGYVYGNGASLPTASTTIPTTVLTGALLAAQFPALTGDVTTVAGALATTLAASGASAGTYTKVTVDAKGRVTVGATFSFATDGTGNLPVTRLNSGTGASGSTCWFGDATWKACTSASGGTVTNTGTMTADRVVLGNAGVDIKVMASAGTATTLLHGGSPPTYSAVDLSADTTGLVPTAKGGTNVNSSGFTGLALVTAGVWSAYAGSGPCGANSFVTAISTVGIVTCTTGGTLTGSGASPRIPFFSSTSVLTSSPVFVFTGGNLGVATASPRASGLGGIDAAGTLAVTANANIGAIDLTASPWNTGGGGLIGWNKTNAQGELDFVSLSGGGSDGGFAFYDLNTQLVRITKAGLVGIGTSAPAFTLDVVATSKAARMSRLTLADAAAGSLFALMANAYYDGADKRLVAGFPGRIILDPVLGSWGFQTAITGAANSTISYLSQLTITATGSVLMGTGQWWNLNNTDTGLSLTKAVTNTTPLLKLTSALANPSFLNSKPLSLVSTITGTRVNAGGGFVTGNNVNTLYAECNDTSQSVSVQLGDRTSVCAMVRAIENAGFTGTAYGTALIYEANATAGERGAMLAAIFAGAGTTGSYYGVNGFMGIPSTATSLSPSATAIFEMNCQIADCATNANGVISQNLQTVFGTPLVAASAFTALATTTFGGSTEAWIDFLRLTNSVGYGTGGIRYRVRNDGSTFADVPSTGATTVLDLRRNTQILFQVDNTTASATDSPALLMINGTLQRVHVGAPGSCSGGANRCLYVN